MLLSSQEKVIVSPVSNFVYLTCDMKIRNKKHSFTILLFVCRSQYGTDTAIGTVADTS